jgi:pimeloyl-ACP methyl ester carboxylesterase
MPQKKTPSRPAASLPRSTTAQPHNGRQTPPPTVSGRWLLTAVSIAIVGAALCAWGVLCLLFWQGSWQLLYHPTSIVARTPASIGLAFDAVPLATTEAGESRLSGWWIPAMPDARYSRYTVLYLHGQDGNLGYAVDALAALHNIDVNVFAFDYRGYGRSQFQRPSETRWREDAEWAIQYLTTTRHIAASTIILDGRDLGANLALEVAAAHPELAGVVLESPLDVPMNAILNDPRARMVPAHLLVRDRFDADEDAAALRIPSLWFTASPALKNSTDKTNDPVGYDHVAAPKMLIWLKPASAPDQHFTDAYTRWLDDLPKRTSNR